MADVQVPEHKERKERNAYLSSRVKETTFREWVVANQIGRLTPPKGGPSLTLSQESP